MCEGARVIAGITYKFYINESSGFDREENYNYIKHDFDCYAQIEFLVVSEDYRRQGLAKELVNAAETEIKVLGVNEVVTSRVLNNNVNFLMERLGYEKKKDSERYKKIIK